MSLEPRWGGEPIDLTARDLPALELSFVLRHVPERGKLLELGCGEGKVRTLACERLDGACSAATCATRSSAAAIEQGVSELAREILG